MAELQGRDTHGKWLDPESDGARQDRAAKELDDEFSGRVTKASDDEDAGSAVERVDFAEAVSDDKADVQKVVKDSRVHEVLEEMDRNLVGLQAVKQRIREMAALLVIDKLRNEMGLI